MHRSVTDTILRIFLCGIIYLKTATGRTVSIDMENYLNCDRSFQISEYEVYEISAWPKQTAIDGRDRCKIQLLGTETRGMTIYLKDFAIYDCGTTMEVYDDDKRMLKPSRVLTCDTKVGETITTQTNNLIIVLVKRATDSMSYKFNLEIGIQKAPNGNGDNELLTKHYFVEEMDQRPRQLGLHKIVRRQSGGGIGGGMSTGAIIGIVIAAILLILIFVGISIFYYLHKKRMEGMNKQSEPSVFVTEPSKKFPTYPQRSTEGSVSSSVTSNGGGYPYVNYAYAADGGDSVSSNEHSSYSTNYSAAPSSDTCRTPKSSMKNGSSRKITSGKSSVRWSASNIEVIEIEQVGNSKSVPKRGHLNEAFDGEPSHRSRSRSPGRSSRSSSKKNQGPLLEIWNADPKPPTQQSRSGHSRHRSRSRSPHSSRRGGRTKSPSGERKSYENGERRSRSPGRPRSGSSISRLSQPVSISSDV